MKRQKFTKQSEVPAPPEAVFAWHEQPGAIERLIPPWEKAEVVERADSLRVGSCVVLKVFAGPIAQLWVAEHVEYNPPHLFADVQRRGPFAHWHHRHRFEPTGRGSTMMIDEIEYALPLGFLGELLGGAFVRAKLRKMFDDRHRVVLEDFRKS